ncbi:NUDIX hydrolase [Frondihabitans cladoniiphilus]|uniref:NUDIX hydrolase n=1 Tax=Frondihabitans cladoniiphilus TaxID=715785 RepID=A0ABP8W9W8_9MICO
MSDAPSASVSASTPGVLSDDDFAVDVTENRVVFEGAVWNIVRDTFRYGDTSLKREYMDHTGAVAIAAQDDQGRILLIKQYRHPVRSRDWELPAGLLDIPGEDPLLAAKRELAEETDLQAATWEHLLTFNTTPGGSNEHVAIYLATGVRAADEAFDREAEEADIEKRWVPVGDVVDGVLGGGLHNSILSIAALALHARATR